MTNFQFSTLWDTVISTLQTILYVTGAVSAGVGAYKVFDGRKQTNGIGEQEGWNWILAGVGIAAVSYTVFGMLSGMFTGF